MKPQLVDNAWKDRKPENHRLLKSSYVAEGIELFVARFTRVEVAPADWQNDPLQAFLVWPGPIRRLMKEHGCEDVLQCTRWGISPGNRKSLREGVSKVGLHWSLDVLRGALVTLRLPPEYRVWNKQSGLYVRDLCVVAVQLYHPLVKVKQRRSQRWY
jgi:hypothetical protein